MTLLKNTLVPTNQFKPYCDSLLTYLHNNPEAAAQAAARISSALAITTTETAIPAHPSPWLMPTSDAAALRRVEWFVHLAATLPEERTAAIRACLASIKQRYEPQAVVLGIVGVAIIGPTLGLIKSKKKKRNQLRVILTEEQYQTLTAPNLAQITTEASTRFLAQELERVAGNAYQLEPELAEWLFTEQQIIIATCENTTRLQAAQRLLAQEHLPHACLTTLTESLVIALSPVAHDDVMDAIGATIVTSDISAT